MALLPKLSDYRYEAIAFLTSAAVMTLEIVGARLIAPHFGTSTYVWTAMIGVILITLAVGFVLGGRLADRFDSTRILGAILMVASLTVLVMGLVQASVLDIIAGWQLDLRVGAFVAALLLFGPPSLLVGMVSPHLAKIRVTSLDTTGRSIGKLEAAGALGSITGTFLCGYFLLGQFGSRSIVVGIAVLLLITSFLADSRSWRKQRLIGLPVVLLAGFMSSVNPAIVLADVDTAYGRYRVVEQPYQGVLARKLLTDNSSIQSAVPADGSETLVLSYVRKFQAITSTYKEPRRALVIGGGSYTFPVALAKAYPEIRVDVAEIDPKLVSLARQYFYYRDSPRVVIHHVDGRAYLNDNRQQYDLIYMDAFSSLSPPFQLTTKEVANLTNNSLVNGGLLVTNLVGSYDNGSNQYLRATSATYKEVFPHTMLLQTDPTVSLKYRQNFMMLASNSSDALASAREAFVNKPLRLDAGGLILSDDFAPVERITY